MLNRFRQLKCKFTCKVSKLNKFGKIHSSIQKIREPKYARVELGTEDSNGQTGKPNKQGPLPWERIHSGKGGIDTKQNVIANVINALKELV